MGIPCMKLKEVDPDIGEREIVKTPWVKRVDRYGRLQAGIELAGQEVLVLLAEVKPGDKEKWYKS